VDVLFASAVGVGVEGPSMGGGGVMDDGDEAVVELLLFFGLWAVFTVRFRGNVRKNQYEFR